MGVSTDRQQNARVLGADPRGVLLVVAILLIPIERDLTIWSLPGDGDNYHLRIGFNAFHIPLTALVLVSVIRLVADPRVPTSLATRLCTAATLWLVFCFALSPTWRGVDVLFHLTVVWAIWGTVRTAPRPSRSRILIALCALGAMEATIAIAQRVTNDYIDIGLIEASGFLRYYGSIAAVRGSFVHQYHFVGLMMICSVGALLLFDLTRDRRARALLTAGLVLFGAVIPMTFSRTAVLGVVPIVIICLAPLGARLRLPGLAWCVGLTAGAAASLDGILARTSSKFTPSEASFDSGRIDRFREALDLIRDHPVVGVGPGNYVAELSKIQNPGNEPGFKVLPSHNVVLHFAAEAGLVGGLLALALLATLAIWAVRGGWLRIIVVVTMVPFLLLDLFSYTWQVGYVMSGLWLGLAQVAGDVHRPKAMVNGPPTDVDVDVGT